MGFAQLKSTNYLIEMEVVCQCGITKNGFPSSWFAIYEALENIIDGHGDSKDRNKEEESEKILNIENTPIGNKTS